MLRRRRRRLAVVVCALAILAAGCHVDTTVTVDVREDGSGVVTVEATLDPAAVQALEAGGTKLENAVRLGDLAAAGWTVSPWVRAEGGSATLKLSKPFSDPAQVASVLGEVSGPAGPLHDFRAVRDRSLVSTRYEVSGTLDVGSLRSGIADDSQLAQSLASQQVDVKALDDALTRQLADTMSLTVVVNLPGSTTKFVGKAGSPVAVHAQKTVVDGRRIGFTALAAILVAAALVVVVRGLRRRHAPQPLR